MSLPEKYPGKRLEEAVFTNADKWLSAVAVRDANETLTYAELVRRARNRAKKLRALGVRPSVHVGVHLNRTVELVITMLAIWEAGGVYVPLDPDYPKYRLLAMLELTAPTLLIVTDRSIRELEWDDALVVDVTELSAPEGDLVTPETDEWRSPEDLAYVMFTSGSTGKPKGVMIPHQNAVSYFRHITETLKVRPGERILQIPPISFDPSIRDIVGTLIAGGELQLIERLEAKDPRAVAEALSRNIHAVLSITPSFLEAISEYLPDHNGASTVLRLIAISGEPLTWRLYEKLVGKLGPIATVVNQYGPTETTMTCASATILRREATRWAPIGTPHADCELLVLNEQLEVCPLGVSGELYIGGTGVGWGYLHQPSLTADRFLPNPFGNGDRLYRSGDLVRKLHDGRLEYLGRRDSQVKIRGIRTEIGEVEEVLRNCDGVLQAAVLVKNANESPELAAFVVLDASRANELSDPAIRHHMRKYLPDAMVPIVFQRLGALPLNANGKIDRIKLASIELLSVPPAKDIEKTDIDIADTVASIWSSILATPVDRDSNFFEVGGHSLAAAHILRQISDHLKVNISFRTFFETPVLSEFAAIVARQKAIEGAP